MTFHSLRASSDDDFEKKLNPAKNIAKPYKYLWWEVLFFLYL